MTVLLVQFRIYTFKVGKETFKAKILKKRSNGIIVAIDGMLSFLKDGTFALIS